MAMKRKGSSTTTSDWEDPAAEFLREWDPEDASGVFLGDLAQELLPDEADFYFDDEGLEMPAEWDSDAGDEPSGGSAEESGGEGSKEVGGSKIPQPPKKSKKVKPPPPPAEKRKSDTKWKNQLIPKSRGGLQNIRANAQTILKHHPAFAGCLAFDAFAQQVVLLREPRWHLYDRPGKALRARRGPPAANSNGREGTEATSRVSGGGSGKGAGGSAGAAPQSNTRQSTSDAGGLAPLFAKPVPWNEDHNQLTASWLERLDKEDDPIGVSLPIHVVREAVRVVARTNPYHPVKDHLDALVWDGKPRLDTWLIRMTYAKDTPYVRAVGAKWIISAVARAYDPGCQADHVLILEGPQRSGKSTILRRLAHDPNLYLSIKEAVGSQNFYMHIRRKWIVELAELDAMSRAETSRVKAVITDLCDTYRRPFAHEDEDQLRRCVFAGTTNDFDGYLKDPTGNARFWPVRTGATVFKQTRSDLLDLERDQLWAEAVFRYKAGEPWHLTDPAILALALKEQEERRQRDPWEGMIQNFVRKSTEGKAAGDGVSIAAIINDCLEIKASHVERQHEMRIGAILRAMGYARTRIIVNGKRTYRYVKQDR